MKAFSQLLTLGAARAQARPPRYFPGGLAHLRIAPSWSGTETVAHRPVVTVAQSVVMSIHHCPILFPLVLALEL